jgi:acetyl-CoA carboxylase biotin carboxyl carrier protein
MAEDTGGAEGMTVDTDLIRQLAELLNASDLSEIEVQDGARRIVVKRKLAQAAVYSAAPQAAAQPAAPPAPPPTAAQTLATEELAAANHPGAVKSPMVGTVYLSGEPGAKPFVQPGDRVEAGDTLLIVEAMKVMNPITATRSGTIKQVLVIDAQPVEYDQPLVIVE